MIELNMEQRSPEWYVARAGVITASGYTNLPLSHRKYTFVRDKVTEIITGEAIHLDLSGNKHVQRGVDMEDAARQAYEAHTGNKVQEIGFVFRDESRRVGCSPDGLIGDDGLIEIKCPSTPVHLNNAIEGPSLDYKRQMQFQMYVTGRQWCDFVSWDDRVNDEGLVMSIHRIEKDIESQLEIDKNVAWALKSIDKKVDKLRKVSSKFLETSNKS